MSIKNVALDSINELLTPMHNDINEKTLKATYKDR